MPDLLVDLQATETAAPLYQRIADSIRADILSGRLRRDERVPSTRSLARELRVNRNTVSQAFDQLIAEGFLTGRHGSGTYVARELPVAQFNPAAPKPAMKQTRRLPPARAPKAPAFFSRILSPDGPQPVSGIELDMRLGQPDIQAFPLRQWRRVINNQLLVARRDRMYYGSAWGLPELRKSIAAYLGRARGIDCDYRNVLITSGSQQGLWLAANYLAGNGDSAMIEDPAYPGAKAVLGETGAKLVPVPVDREGAISAAVSEIVKRGPAPKLLYLTPSHQYPTGATLSAARRIELLELAARHGFMILEDDYDSEYRYEGRPVRAMAGIDSAGVVCYVGSFNKVMYPGLRLGYLVAPQGMMQGLANLRWHADFMPPTLESAAMAQFIEEGHFERHLRRMRALYAEKREAFVGTLKQLLPMAVPNPLPPGGMKLNLNVPRHLSREEALQRAYRSGVRIFDLSSCYADPARAPRCLTTGFTALSLKQVEEAARRIALAWRV